MSKPKNGPRKFDSISALHRALGLPKPLHPLVSLVDYGQIQMPAEELPKAMLLDFYKISYKTNLTGRVRYGQHYYDFDEGGISFIAPNQLIAADGTEQDLSGHTLLIHPDFLRHHALAKTIRGYGFFAYAANEALHLSEKERFIITEVFAHIAQELEGNIDTHTQNVLIAHIEVLLRYSDRFYARQFITRKAANQDLLTKVDELLEAWFATDRSLMKGLPTVQYIADELHLSPNYLSDLLRSLTGQNTQQHIHEKLIAKAKEYLVSDDLSVAEVAYQLGFEHPQSFNRIFKQKTDLTPIAFKRSFHRN